MKEVVLRNVWQFENESGETGFSFSGVYPHGYWYVGSWSECKSLFLDEFGSDFEDAEVHFVFHMSEKKFNSIGKDFRSVWQGVGNGATHPEWIGCRTCFRGCFTGEADTALLVEGVHFEIDKDPIVPYETDIARFRSTLKEQAFSLYDDGDITESHYNRVIEHIDEVVKLYLVSSNEFEALEGRDLTLGEDLNFMTRAISHYC